MVEVPAGRHDVSWDWAPFGPLPAARIVSAATAAAVLFLFVVPALHRKRPVPWRRRRQVSPEAPRS